MKQSLVLVLCLALPALAQEAPAGGLDAPLAPVLVLKGGEVAPGPGLFLSEPQAVAQAKRVAACEAERDSLKGNLGVPVWVPVVVGVLALGAGTGLGVLLVKK